MSTVVSSRQSASPLGYLSNLTALFIERFTKKKLSDASIQIHKFNDEEIKYLETLNNYNKYSIEDIEPYEEMINSRRFLVDLLNLMNTTLNETKNKIDSTDNVYNELIHFCNSFSSLIDTNEKVVIKLDEIHNKILTKTSEAISADVLDDVWKGEDEIWDKFYLESQAS